MPPKKKTEIPLSKRPVVCGEGSKSLERRDQLKNHFETCLPGKHPFEKGQTTLSFNSPPGPGVRKRTVTQNENILSPSDDQFMSDSSVSMDTNENISPLGSPLFTPISINTDKTDSDIPSASETRSFSVPLLTLSSSSGSVHENSFLIGQICSLLGQLELNVCPSSSDMPPPENAINSHPPAPKPSACPTATLETPQSSKSASLKSNAKSKLEIQSQFLKEAKCLKQVVELLDDVFELNFEQSELHCVFCLETESRTGRFNVEDVEWERGTALSQKFRNMTKLLRNHIKCQSHQGKVRDAAANNLALAQRGERNREMGRRLGTLAYFLFYNNLPFTLYESFLPWFTLNNIDVGEINHSRYFVRNFVDSVYSVLIDRLKVFLQKPLPCTGKPSPIAILGDKGTIKRDVTQPTLIRVASPGKNKLFRKFYMSHPEVLSHTGENVTELLLHSIKTTLGWSIQEIRERFCGGSFDGQYFKLNVPKHLATKLSLEHNFTIDALIWDVAHRFELGCEDVKNITPWLQELDTTLQSVMKKFSLGMHHTNLRDIGKEMNIEFKEFCLFSDTRFIEYSHRTYDHFVLMYPLLITKIQRDIGNDTLDTDLQQDREHCETLLAQVTFVLNLTFMREASHLYTIFSKNSQAFDVLPFHSMNQFDKLKSSLSKAQVCLNAGNCPEIEIISFHSTKKSFHLWEDFRNYVTQIVDTQKFCGFNLLLPAERGRVTRSVSTFAEEMGGYNQLVKSCFKQFASYIEIILFHLHCRFVPWPAWLVSCNSCFNFMLELPDETRQTSFGELLEEKSGPVPLTAEEKNRLKAEYTSLLVIISSLKESDQVFESPEEIWYLLLTTEKYYTPCKNLNEFALRFLTRTSNECIVESQVSTIENIETSSRHLKHIMGEKLTFIKTNGPHPYSSLGVIHDALNKYFKGKPWHFVLTDSNYFTSKVIDRQIREYETMTNDLA